MPRGLPRTLGRAVQRLFGAQNGVAGLSRNFAGGAGAYQVVIKLNDVRVTVTDALAYASLKILDLPEGRVTFKGGTASLQFAVMTARASTINDSAGLSWALGTAAASNISLTSTMVDIVAATTKALAAATTALNTASTANGAASNTQDGTGTAKDIYLNLAFPTNTDIDGDGVLAVFGTITLNLEVMGDY